MSKRKKRGKLLFLAAVFAAACGAGAWQYLKLAENDTKESDAYKTETVKKGTVSTGINEDGTVEFGAQEQIFSVAEITDTSVSASADSSSEGTADTGGTAGASGGSRGSGKSTGDTAGMSTGMTSMGMSMMSSSGTEETAGEDTALEVEEVYLAAGSVVKKGDKILKIAQDSIEKYRTQLEATVETAKLSVSQEEINVESKRAEAEYTYQMYLAEGETAEETYQASITSLENAVTQLEEELEEALEDGDEETAEELEAELQIAKNNQITQSIEAKQIYENAMTNYKYAQQLYEIDTNGLEDDLNDAKEILMEAEQNLADFQEQIGDGIVYAEYSGTVTAVSYKAGDLLVNDSAVASFTDLEDVTMTVSVSQEDIAQITVGDEAAIQLTAYAGETFAGEVSSIAATASVGSSTVNYDVKVRFTGDTGKVYFDMTGEVTFAGKTVGDTLYISNRAVFMEAGRSYVKVMDSDGSIRTVQVMTGFSNGSIVAVESGLEEGQKVVIESKVTG